MRKMIINILESKSRMMMVFRFALILALVAMGIARLQVVFFTWRPEFLYYRDVVQYYLMGKALIVGEYIYQPMDILAQTLTGGGWFYPHPSPYAPPLALLCVPLALGNLSQASPIWFTVEIAALFFTSAILVAWFNKQFNLIYTIILLFVMISFHPIGVDLIFGQTSVILLGFLTAAWYLIRSDRKIAGGLLLGLSMSIKVITWPIFLYYLIQRQWRILITASVTVLALHVATVLVIGIDPILDYYLHVTAEVLPYYQANTNNISLWSLGWRLFSGTDAQILLTPISSPLIYLPSIAPVASGIILVLTLISGTILAYRSRDEDIAIAIMICVSLLISPITWIHYLSMAVLPVAVIIWFLKKRKFPAIETSAFTLIFLALFALNEKLLEITRFLSGSPPPDIKVFAAPFAVNLLSMLPALEIVGCMLILWRLRSGAHTPRDP